MGPVLLLPPVAEVLVFPLDRLLPLPPATTLLPLPPSTCSRSYGWAWARLPQTRALRHPAPPPPFHPTSTATTTPSLPSHYLACFPLSSPYCSVLCDLLKPGRHVITLLDTKNSRQPVFLVEEEEKEEGKQSDTTNPLSGHSVQPERTCRFCQKTLISFSRKNVSDKRIKCSMWFSLTRKVDTVEYVLIP